MSVPPRAPMKRKKRTARTIRLSCDKLWSQLVRSQGFCEKCGRSDGVLHAHHVYGRTDYRLRFEPRNGCCLCYRCHRWAEGFPLEFAYWFELSRFADAEWLLIQRAKGPLRRTTADYLRLEAELAEALE